MASRVEKKSYEHKKKPKFNIKDVIEFISNTSPETKIYIGADSVRYKKQGQWYAHYTAVCVIHFDGKHGCKIFGFSDVQRDYDNKKKPMTRLMN